MAYSNSFVVTTFTKATVNAAQIAAAIVEAHIVDPDVEIVHVLCLSEGDQNTYGTVAGDAVIGE